MDAVIQNRWTKLNGEWDLDLLLPMFSYRPPGAFFMQKRFPGWNGYVDMVHRFDGGLRVPTGLFLVRREEMERQFDFTTTTKLQKVPFNMDKLTGFTRPYQEECTRAMVQATQASGGLVLAATASGKTMITGMFFKALLATGCFVVDELTLLYQTKKELERVMGECVGVIGDSTFAPARITVATVQTLAIHCKSLKFQAWSKKLGVVVVDECFPAGTAVTTDRGKLDIRTIVEKRLPVRVWSKDLETGKYEWQPVIRWIKLSCYTKMVTIHYDGGQLTCTANHLIWTTQYGYIRADSIRPGTRIETIPLPKMPEVVSGLPFIVRTKKVLFQDVCQRTAFCNKDVREVPQGIQISEERRKSSAASPVLWYPMQVKMGGLSATRSEKAIGCYTQNSSIESWKEITEKRRANAATQPYAQSEMGQKSGADEETQWNTTSVDGYSRRKRQTVTDSTNKVITSPRSKLVCRICNSIRWSFSRVPNLLQGRPGISNEAASSRSRRTRPFQTIFQEQGFEENTKAKFVKVDCVTVHERTDCSKSVYGTKENPDYVYCLEVEKNHNFYADGVLVSNCHTMLRWLEKSKNRAIIDQLKPLAVIGLTATLNLNKQDVAMRAYALAGPVCYEYKYAKGREEGYLTKGNVVQVCIPTAVTDSNDPMEDYRTQAVENYELNAAACDLVEEGSKRGFGVILLTDSISQLHQLSDMLQHVRHSLVHGAIPVLERQKHIRMFEAGKLNVLLASKVFKKGIDLPSADCLIDTANRKSPEDAIQKFGRGARLAKGKRFFLYFDLSIIGTRTQPDKHGKVHPGRLTTASSARKRSFLREGIDVLVATWVQDRDAAQRLFTAVLKTEESERKSA